MCLSFCALLPSGTSNREFLQVCPQNAVLRPVGVAQSGRLQLSQLIKDAGLHLGSKVVTLEELEEEGLFSG